MTGKIRVVASSGGHHTPLPKKHILLIFYVDEESFWLLAFYDLYRKLIQRYNHFQGVILSWKSGLYSTQWTRLEFLHWFFVGGVTSFCIPLAFLGIKDLRKNKKRPRKFSKAIAKATDTFYRNDFFSLYWLFWQKNSADRSYLTLWVFLIFINFLSDEVFWPAGHFFGYWVVVSQKGIPIGLQATL